MDRRDCFALPLILAGCGGSDMEYEIQPSPHLRTAKNVFPGGLESSWTPAFTFDTPGDLFVSYGAQEGYYFRIGGLIICFMGLTIAGFTHSTASGSLRITGLPFKPRIDINSAFAFSGGNLNWRGITKTNWTDLYPRLVAQQNYFNLILSGSGQDFASVTTVEAPTGAQLSLIGVIFYVTDEVS